MKKSSTIPSKEKSWKIWIVSGAVIAISLLLLLSTQLEEMEFVAAFLWIVAVLILLWVGNRFIHDRLNSVYPWVHQPFRRFFIQLVASALYSLACVNASYYFLKTLLLGLPPDTQQILVLNLYGLLFIIPVISFNFGIYFMIRWKKAFLQSEKLKEENLRSRLESLKTHVDPHFLFNNLNVLSSLIEIDPHEAQQFLERFSDVYRYVLQHKDEELVDLDTEIEFIQSYTFLFRQRLNKQLNINMEIRSEPGKFYIPPLSLQMLLENAIKHNKATASHPLSIHIYLENEDCLIVRNTFQPKNTERSNLPKVGLENIRKRFEYFSDRKVIIEQDKAYFTVKLPLLEWEDIPPPLSEETLG